MTYEILENGRLLLKASPEDFADLEEGETLTIDELLEPLLCNSELQWIDPADTGDMTSAPMLGMLGLTQIGEERPGYIFVGRWDGYTRVEPILQRWAWMHYEVTDLVEELRDKGEALLDGGSFMSEKVHPYADMLQKLVRCRDEGANYREYHELATEAADILGNGERHFIVTGRIPGQDEDTVGYVVCATGESPWQKFVREDLYIDMELPEDWSSRAPFPYENAHGAWAFQGAIIQILGPPIRRCA